jgi:hypothetical protein
MSPAALIEIEEKTQELVDLALIQDLVEAIYALDVSEWADKDLEVLERVIDRTISLLSAMPNRQNRPLIERLLAAREGVEQGMSPDPAKRPSLEELSTFVAAHLP